MQLARGKALPNVEGHHAALKHNTIKIDLGLTLHDDGRCKGCLKLDEERCFGWHRTKRASTRAA